MKCKWNEKLFYTSKQILKLLHLPKYLKKTDDEVELYKQPEIKTTKYCLSMPQWICKTPLELHDLKAEFITGEAIFKTRLIGSNKWGILPRELSAFTNTTPPSLCNLSLTTRRKNQDNLKLAFLQPSF